MKESIKNTTNNLPKFPTFGDNATVLIIIFSSVVYILSSFFLFPQIKFTVFTAIMIPSFIAALLSGITSSIVTTSANGLTTVLLYEILYGLSLEFIIKFIPIILFAVLISIALGYLRYTNERLHDEIEKKDEIEIENLLRNIIISENHVRLKHIFDNAGVGFYRTTPKGDVIFANKAMAELLGYNEISELLRINLEEKNEHFGYSRFDFKNAMEKLGKIAGIEDEWTSIDGKRITIRETAWKISDSRGNTLYYDGIVEDISKNSLHNHETHTTMDDLKNAGDDLNIRNLIAICSSCKKIRNEDGDWVKPNKFHGKITDIEYSHSLCPDCAKDLYPTYGG